MSLKPGIEFTICTYNRIGYLKNCIAALLPQLVPGSTGLIVIDNDSTDDTPSWVLQLMSGNSMIRYFHEPKIGLSHARNRAMQEASYEWIFYLDDDCIPTETLVESALHLIIPDPAFTAVGGKIIPVTDEPVHKIIPNRYGEFILPYTQTTIIEKEAIRGGCMMFRTDALQKSGGFDPGLGMVSDHIGYGEEIEIQQRMRRSGYRVAYAPSLEVFHVVREEKRNARWILVSEYARRRDKRKFEPIAIGQGVFDLTKTIAGRVIWLPVYTFKLISKRSYSIHNYTLDVFKPLMYRWGDLVGSWRSVQRRKS